MGRRSWVGAGLGAGLVAAVGIGLVVAPAGAAAAPPLPPVSPEDLVSSVMTAQRGPFAGEVEVDNALGLPAVPGVPQLANGTSTIRVWSGGEDRGRVAIPSPEGERTLVSDGTTRWAYDSQDRTATRSPAGEARERPDGAQDPTAAATQAIATLRQTSTVAVDGTAEVAGRAAYQLVLTPQPTERTLLREVRVAVDAETRLPLQLTVLAQGSGEPALQVGFSEITYGPQDPALFTFTPPPGTTVRDGQAREGRPDRPEGEGQRRTVGDGWDTVIVGQAPAREAREGGEQQQRPEGAPNLDALGTPVTGPWGSGRVITTAVATVIITDDGRIAAGAVPQQVLTEALAQ